MLPRILAFLLDYALIVVITAFLLFKILLPNEFHQELDSFYQYHLEKFEKDPGSLFTVEKENVNPVHLEIMVTMTNYSIIFFWAYFFFSELFMKGTSLGKKTFGLRVISLKSGDKPSILDTSFRALMKSIAFVLPILTIANYILPFFNSLRRAGHDLVCKTIVVQGYELPKPPPQEDF